jgi:drug/metabolite transporter (DMT)-like permease
MYGLLISPIPVDGEHGLDFYAALFGFIFGAFTGCAGGVGGALVPRIHDRLRNIPGTVFGVVGGVVAAWSALVWWSMAQTSQVVDLNTFVTAILTATLAGTFVGAVALIAQGRERTVASPTTPEAAESGKP